MNTSQYNTAYWASNKSRLLKLRKERYKRDAAYRLKIKSRAMLVAKARSLKLKLKKEKNNA